MQCILKKNNPFANMDLSKCGRGLFVTLLPHRANPGPNRSRRVRHQHLADVRRLYMEVSYRRRDFDGNVLNEKEPASHRISMDPERVLRELGGEVTEDSLLLLPKLLPFLKHHDPIVVKQSITTGTSLFCAVLTEIALQLNKSNRVERWLEKIWFWMLQFKDAVFGIVLESGSVGAKVLAIKFLEACVLSFTSDVGSPSEEGSLSIIFWPFDY
ncbi:hypothetical protein AXF42_Ash002242 [Apostasia shenzhenica]|uniref:Symplekin/Pta1 N-terminal domain-containing protein n=1 Tax=Apostasia shenzhenica TaxID=1088818 RepID=A0A2I0AMY8_9ASPA|nr:hypothetical protein AXF42_Ash002242 [Apostasia shenzhenica]